MSANPETARSPSSALNTACAKDEPAGTGRLVTVHVPMPAIWSPASPGIACTCPAVSFGSAGLALDTQLDPDPGPVWYDPPTLSDAGASGSLGATINPTGRLCAGGGPTVSYRLIE